MSIVKVKTNGQVTLPTALREQAGLKVGDLLEINLEQGKITLTPTTLVEQRVEESLEDYRQGRTYGPFESAEELIQSLRQPSHATNKRTKQPRKRSK